MTRLVLVLAALAIVAVVWALHRRRLREAQRVHDGERLPAELLDGSGQRTWVLVTTPRCAACDAVEAQLRQFDPEGRLVTVDAAERPDLARALRVRAAPTVLLASPSGFVRHRLAGPAAVASRLDEDLVSSAAG
jgi:hypothetical protein